LPTFGELKVGFLWFFVKIVVIGQLKVFKKWAKAQKKWAFAHFRGIKVGLENW